MKEENKVDWNDLIEVSIWPVCIAVVFIGFFTFVTLYSLKSSETNERVRVEAIKAGKSLLELRCYESGDSTYPACVKLILQKN